MFPQTPGTKVGSVMVSHGKPGEARAGTEEGLFHVPVGMKQVKKVHAHEQGLIELEAFKGHDMEKNSFCVKKKNYLRMPQKMH